MRPGPGYRARSATPSSCRETASTSNLPNGIVSGLHDFTISAWVNPSANSAWSRVFDFGTGTNDYMFLTLSAGGGPLLFADHPQRQRRI